MVDYGLFLGCDDVEDDHAATRRVLNKPLRVAKEESCARRVTLARLFLFRQLQ